MPPSAAQYLCLRLLKYVANTGAMTSGDGKPML